MLESRAAYGYYGEGNGATGETPNKFIEREMYYWEYKNRYPECKNLGDYNKITKTITVLIPVEYTERPNYGNHFTYNYYDFIVDWSNTKFANIFNNRIEIKAKTYENALKQIKKMQKSDGFEIVKYPI